MADTREESSEESSDSTSSDNFSIYTETSSSEQDLQNLARTSTSSATTPNSRKGYWKIIFEIADCEKVQASYKQSKRRSNEGIDLVEQLFFRGKSLSKNKPTCENAVAWIYGSWTLLVMGSWDSRVTKRFGIIKKIVIKLAHHVNEHHHLRARIVVEEEKHAQTNKLP